VAGGRYLTYGLVIESELTLFQSRPAGDGPADLLVCWGAPRPVPSEAAPDRVIGSLPPEGPPFFSLSEKHDGAATLRFHGQFDFELNPAGDRITVHPDPHVDRAWAPAFFEGTVMSIVLTRRQQCVLHASAVVLGDAAVAFVGASGAGKTTSAGLACSQGAQLLTDDVLPVAPSGTGITCTPGSTELRLRKKTGPLDLATRLVGPRRTTVDDRLAIAIGALDLLPTPLAALVLVRPVREGDVRLRDVAPADALLELLRYPRTVRPVVRDGRAAQFHQLAEVARRVPAYELDVPWGPPWPDVLDALSLISRRA